MHDRDKDLEDLERLFGHVKADYRDMRHQGELGPLPAPVRRQREHKYFYFGAGSAVAVMLLAVISANLPAPQSVQNPIRLTIPDRGTLPLTLRPVGKIKPRSLPSKSVSLRLPRRPMAKKG